VFFFGRDPSRPALTLAKSRKQALSGSDLYGKVDATYPSGTVRSVCLMETQKVLCYVAMGIAALVCLIFLLDAGGGGGALWGSLGRQSIPLDVMFILGAHRPLARV